LANLVVEAARDVAHGARVVVLDEGTGATGNPTELLFTVRFHEEAAVVGVDGGFED
jgi:ABC-type sugar transport system ATPase subunit